MDKDRIKKILNITIGLTIIIFIILLLQGVEISSWEGFLKKAYGVFPIVIIFWTFYFSLGWKWPILKYLVYTENLNGTWFGKYNSNNSCNNENFEGEISIVIRQTFLAINIISYTNNYLSYSYGEAILFNSRNKSNQLIYLYSQNQYEPIDNLARRGASELNLRYESGQKKLFGTFWTNNNSRGGLYLYKKTSKHLDSFTAAKNY